MGRDLSSFKVTDGSASGACGRRSVQSKVVGVAPGTVVQSAARVWCAYPPAPSAGRACPGGTGGVLDRGPALLPGCGLALGRACRPPGVDLRRVVHPSHGAARELDAVRVVEHAVADGVGVVGVADDGVPVGHGQLASDVGGGAFGAVLDDLGEVAAGLLRRPVADGASATALRPRPRRITQSGVSRFPGTTPAMRPPDRLGGRAARGPLASGTPSTRIRGAGRRTRGPRIRPGGAAPPPRRPVGWNPDGGAPVPTRPPAAGPAASGGLLPSGRRAAVRRVEIDAEDVREIAGEDVVPRRGVRQRHVADDQVIGVDVPQAERAARDGRRAGCRHRRARRPRACTSPPSRDSRK